ncbi:hypothetical protein [Algoriphagus sp. CAU 1675]|uniref:hypothetical protein n=1 Tax=Algoriphagus sp. CAU 1675 TaxID=3032597 RepID=UPI0023DB61CC|nr:hypothetical protein [Algoriphagus sp. CAU 1675]MDF2157203.1 hypothetical protein [Algoriphagus sp. CAU 1675]
MAKQSKNMDQVFRERLENHQVKPSALAWEQLENQLPVTQKSYKGYWWAAAAGILVLLAAGILFKPGQDQISEERLLAEENPSLEIPVQEKQGFETEIEENSPVSNPVEESETIKVENTAKTETKQKKQVQPAIQEPSKESPKNLVALAETQEEPKATEIMEKISIEPIILETEIPDLPQLQLQTTIAEASPQVEEEPSYKITIFSDGIKEDKTIIDGIEKRVDQVEGLLGKVDSGFAGLQDAKNNLFATLTTKKDRLTEKP